MFGSDRRYAWPVVNRCINVLPEPSTMVREPRSKHIGPWSTDLKPRSWALDLGTRQVSKCVQSIGPGVEWLLMAADLDRISIFFRLVLPVSIGGNLIDGVVHDECH